MLAEKILSIENEIKLDKVVGIICRDHYLAHDVLAYSGVTQENLVNYRVTRYFMAGLLLIILIAGAPPIITIFLLWVIYKLYKKRKTYDHDLSLDIQRDAALPTSYISPSKKEENKKPEEQSNFREVSKDKYDTSDMYD